MLSQHHYVSLLYADIVVAKMVLYLGWTLATNTRYPFPKYAPKGVVRKWINIVSFIQLTSGLYVTYPTTRYMCKINNISTDGDTQDTQ